MIGIDLVDLKDPLLKERFSPSMRFISHPSDQIIPHPQIFWLMWTAKEAVYKANRQSIAFDPKKIPVICQSGDSNYTFTSDNISGQFIFSEELIIAICSFEGRSFKYDFWESENLSSASTEVRSRAKIHYFLNNGNKVNIGIDKSGIPIFMESEIPLTFTHHGRYCGFIYLD
jgi:hypothetical protein